MTWSQALWAVDGNTLPGSAWRQQLQSATLAAQGIVNPGDLKVTAFGTPGAGVNIAGGACVIVGAEAANQGSYYGVNIGTDTVSVAATGGTGRSDLIIARVEDPTVAGVSWGWNPATDQLVYTRDISGVSSSTKIVPVGTSGIPLARIDIPASTSAITNAMITDLRGLINPLRDRELLVINPTATDQLQWNQSGYRSWPTGVHFSVDVPTWAKTMRFVYTIGQLLVDPNSTSGPNDQFRCLIGSTASQSAILNGAGNAAGRYRFSASVADNINVTAYQGTTITVQPQGNTNAGGAGGFYQIDSGCSLILDYEFIEGTV